MTYRFMKPDCPECGGQVQGVVETMETLRYLEPTEDGGFAYRAHRKGTRCYEDFFETEQPLNHGTEDDPIYTLRCEDCSHLWETAVWTPCDEGCPGWAIFNIDRGGEVQKCDTCGRFESDDDVWRAVPLREIVAAYHEAGEA